VGDGARANDGTVAGLDATDALQVEYSLLARTVEGELAPLADDQGKALVPWSPLKNGFLSGKYRPGCGADGRTGAKVGRRFRADAELPGRGDWRHASDVAIAGTTVDGESSAVYPPLLVSEVRE